MTRNRREAPWLSRALLLRLLLPLLLIIAATAGLGAYAAHRLTAQVFDRWLLDAARSVASIVRFERGEASLSLPTVAETLLLFDDNDLTYFSVTQGNRLLAGRSGIPTQGRKESSYRRGVTYEAQFDRHLVRIARVELEDGNALPVTILVAETQSKRRRSAEELFIVFSPMAVLFVTAALAIILAVRRTMRPLEQIAASWNARSHVSLQAISDDDVPRELRPFTAALNDLLRRIREMLVRERQFAATAAHQLRTPLAGLQLGLSRAAEARDMTEARVVLGELSQSTQRTARLVQQLLALGSLDLETRGDLNFRNVDLTELARNVGAAHTEKALAKSIELELVASESVFAWVIPDLVAEALGNLLDNAIHYTPIGGNVVIKVSSLPIEIRISDSGSGIPETERHTVFERFVRGRLASGEGSGLGLAIVRDIALLHGASASLETSSLGGLSARIVFSH